MAERAESGSVAWHAVVAVMPFEHAAEPLILLVGPFVHSSPYVLVDCGELCSSLLATRPPMKGEATRSILPCDVRETEEDKRLGFVPPVAFDTLSGEAPETNHARLVGV